MPRTPRHAPVPARAILAGAICTDVGAFRCARHRRARDACTAYNRRHGRNRATGRPRERGRTMDLPYAGALLPAEAHRADAGRREAGGRAHQAGARLRRPRAGQRLPIEWQTYPGNHANPEFLAAAGRARAQGRAGDVPVPLRRALALGRRAPRRRRAGGSATTSSRASKATRTPRSTAAPWAAGRRPACPGSRASPPSTDREKGSGPFSAAQAEKGPDPFFSRRSSHPAEVGGQQHNDAESDAVPGERPEVVRSRRSGSASGSRRTRRRRTPPGRRRTCPGRRRRTAPRFFHKS